MNIQPIQALTDSFAIPGVLRFETTETGLTRAHITTKACTAELFLYGAHLTAWQPTGEQPVLFLSSKSALEHGKAIRGGVPLIFPWFGGRTPAVTDSRGANTDPQGPSHGFARIQDWQLTFAAMAGDDLRLTLTLAPSEESKKLGWDHFKLAFELTLGRSLTMRLTVANEGSEPVHFEEALHTYLTVGNPEHVRITGLADTDYIDKVDHFTRKHQGDSVLTLSGSTDRPYLNTTATVTMDDPDLHRRITVSKKNSRTTVVWNPWTEGTAKIADLNPDDWRHYTCIETANAGDNIVSLAPKATHTMESHITVDRQ